MKIYNLFLFFRNILNYFKYRKSFNYLLKNKKARFVSWVDEATENKVKYFLVFITKSDEIYFPFYPCKGEKKDQAIARLSLLVDQELYRISGDVEASRFTFCLVVSDVNKIKKKIG